MRPKSAAQPAVPGEGSWKLPLGLLLVALVPRLLLFPLGENLYGDAVVRTELAEKWLAQPRWISSFQDGAFQFGPLHLYGVALFLKLFPREDAGRALSLLFGVLSVLPLFALTRRLFDSRAALWACLAFSTWGMHLQFSTTAASESLALFLFLWALSLFARGLGENRAGPLLLSALVWNLACATRYDVWLFLPLLGLLLLWGTSDRVAGVTRALIFGLACLPFPLAWMQGNELAHGDPFFPIRNIHEFHLRWFGESEASWGAALFRGQNLLFWPGAALLTLSPLVALFGAAGMVRCFRRRPETRWLFWMALLPALYFTLRSTLLGSFAPLARFTAPQLVLLLPFVSEGFDWLAGRGPYARWVAAGAIAVAVLLPLSLGAFTFRAEGKLQDALRPISPVTTNPRAVTRLARFLERELGPKDEALILDADPRYWDIQIGFFSGLPRQRLASLRLDTFEEVLRSADPRYLLRVEGGLLERSEGFQPLGPGVSFRGRHYAELPGFQPPFHLYLRND